MKTRIVIPNVPHHVGARGNNRRRLFSYPRDYRTYFELLARGLASTGCELNALCLMSNHIHLLITPPTEDALSRLMHGVHKRYAVLRNATRNATGKLFEKQFFSEPMRDERHTGILTCYIEANAERGGLVDDSERYRWSTYRLSSGSPKKSEWWADLWTPSAWYMSLGESAEERAWVYRAIFQDYLVNNVTPDDLERLERMESLSTVPYRHRLRRPDESRCNEPAPPGGRFGSDDE